MQRVETKTSQLYPSYTLMFVDRKEEYEGVYSYIFEPTDRIQFTAGEYAHVRIPTLPISRPVREYSFASAPQDEQIVFGIDHRSRSEYQKALLALTAGDTVELFKIKSHMTWPPPRKDAVMVAGGVGVTPFRSMLRDKAAMTLTVTLVHVAKDQHLYGEELSRLASEYRGIRRSELQSTLLNIGTEHRDAHFYIAGPPDFVTAAAETLAQAGIQSVESDAFKGLPFYE